jgi:ribosomal protein L35
MTLKKFRAKTHKGAKKRIRISNGGDKSKGLLMVNRINHNHLQNKKARKVNLRFKRDTALGKTAKRLKKLL